MGTTLNGCLKILGLLNAVPSRILSVQELCAKLGYTQDILLQKLKALNALEYLVSDLGDGTLFLNRQLDFYNEVYIHQHTKGKGRVSVLECIGSTNTEMLTRPSSLVSGDVILAEIQYGGRSRRSTKWFCPIGSQLTMSICALFDAKMSLSGLSVASGVKIATVLHRMGVSDVKVKWPNDIYVQGRKICGILIESINNQHGCYVITGVGLNVHQEGFDGLETPHISLAETGINVTRNEVAIEVIDALRELFESFPQQGFLPYQADFERWDYLKGQTIAVQTEDRRYQGTACGVDERGALLLQTSTNLEHLNSGHIL